jgi:parallel beta-helix repeat protein
MNATNSLFSIVPSASLTLRKPLALAAASLLLSAIALPAFAALTPAATIGTITVDVRSKGAVGDGVHNDTAAFQAAINSLPSTGGTVTVPAGRYMIDASRSISLRSNMRLQMDPLAQLDVIPNGLTRYYVIKAWKVNNVQIVGGSIVGDRVKHTGTTGEWGFGINITASTNVTVTSTKISNCWGDGIWIGAMGTAPNIVMSSNVTINGVVSDNNRRQGLSIGPAHDIYIVNSTFSNSNGAPPQAGIDIEPQTQGTTANVRLENNKFVGNRGNGIEVQSNVSSLVVTKNTMSGNYGFGIYTGSPNLVNITANLATQNGLAGVAVRGASNNVNVVNNTLTFNNTRYIAVTATGKGGVSRDLQIATTATNVYVANNTLSP